MTVKKKPILQVLDVSYVYPGSQHATLNNVNLNIYENEIVSIIGKVGTGKSTLLRLLTGLIEPTKGQILLHGQSLDSKEKEKGKKFVGLLFENPDDQLFYPVVSDDIAFGPRNLGLSKKDVHNRVIDACAELDILHLLERESGSLSLGEKTLVAIAGLLAMNNEILILDGPEIGLDLWTKPQILKLLFNLKNKHTIVVSTNDLDILKMSDQIHVLWNGTIKANFSNFADMKKALAKE